MKLNIYSTVTDQSMISPTVYYSKVEILNYCFNTLFQTTYLVEMAGGVWFAFPLIVLMSIFCIIRYFGSILKLKTMKKEIYSAIVVIILGSIEIIFAMKSLKFAWRVDVALFAMLLFIVDIYVRSFGIKLT